MLSGTALMFRIAGKSETETVALMSAHGITGLIAIILMVVHAIWAIIVLKKDRTEELLIFHRFSIVVWGIWLIPYILGMIMGSGAV